MYRPTIIIILLFCQCVTHLFGQQLPIFTQYRDHYGIINPAMINSDYFTLDYNFAVGASSRIQWANSEFTPHTETIHAEYYNNNGFIFGGHLINDRTGHTSLTSLGGRVGFIVAADDRKNWGFAGALSSSVVQYRISADGAQFGKNNDPILGFHDQKVYPDVGAGLFGYFRGLKEGDMFYIGASIPQLLSTKIAFDNNKSKVELERVQHFYGVLGMYKSIDDTQSFELSTWAKSVKGSPINITTNFRLLNKKLFWVGLGLSTNRIFHVEGGIMIGEKFNWSKNYRIGYSYDASFNTTRSYFGGAHEISIIMALDTRGDRYGD
jgi:type IX secretion system PorP/SprF family membrane protein